MITKKPKTTKLNDKEIDALISKGGDVPPSVKDEVESPKNISKKSQKKIPVQLRLTQELIDTIDGIIDKRMIKISRHTWFLEAIEAKIKSEIT